MKISNNTLYFAHGQESGPWGTKIQYLAEIARGRGFHVESPDYSHIPDPDDRVRSLLDQIPRPRNTSHDSLERPMDSHGDENGGKLVLAGSSAGGYVSAVASEFLNPDGLFLMAPAVSLRGFGKRNPQPNASHRWVVHGWDDDIVSPQSVIGFAAQHKMQLHMLDGDHRLVDVLPTVGTLFALFLEQVLSDTKTA